jgi:hypothetical protein
MRRLPNAVNISHGGEQEARRPIERVLDRLNSVKSHNGYYTTLCPAHDDRKPSLSVSEGDDGRVLIKCHAGCSTEDVVSSIGLRMSDLFEHHRNGGAGRGALVPPGNPATAQPCTLLEYAYAKRLRVEHLKKLGLSDIHYQGRPAVRIPYKDPHGEEVAVRLRMALDKSEGDRFRWRRGDKPTLYGLWLLDRMQKAGYVVLVEGESDCHTLWQHGVPALGIPGASVWKEEWATHLEGFEKVYAVIEPDGGGETLLGKLTASSVRDLLHLVDLGEHEDASELYLFDPEAFEENLRRALEAAIPWTEQERAESEAKARESWEKCETLAREPRILEQFAQSLAKAGVVGESRLAKLLFLIVVSRFLDRPVSAAVKGPSSGGKSYLVESVLRFFPESAYYALTAMSDRALAYSEEPLSHRFLVLYEAAGMGGDFATYLMRSLLSEGRLRYETVEKVGGELKPRLIEREGPTGLIVTTTAARLHPENETRMLSLSVTDTPEQTRHILAALARESGEGEPDLEEWHALQEWLETGEHRVTIPFAQVLAERIPAVAVRLRRDFGALLCLIRAHAILHQATRERDPEGRIIATLDDYAVVRELVADLVAEGVEATVSKHVRETVEAVKRLHADASEPVTNAAVARELNLDKSAASRRVRVALDGGYLKNLEDRKGRPARLEPGDPLPDDVVVLPTPEEVLQALQCCEVVGGDEHPPLTLEKDEEVRGGPQLIRFADLPDPEPIDTSEALAHDLISWERILAEEPEVGEVFRELESVRSKHQRWARFDHHHNTTPKAYLCKLVGWHARNPRLRSQAAYCLVMERMWELVL